MLSQQLLEPCVSQVGAVQSLEGIVVGRQDSDGCRIVKFIKEACSRQEGSEGV